MDTIPQDIPNGKHYTYVLEYPEDYPDDMKAGTVFYVGKGIDDRIEDHERDAKRERGRNTHKLNVIRKIWTNGGQVAKSIIAYFETHEEACMLEIALIFFLPNLTNLTNGGDGSMGYVPTEETLRKLSESHKGHALSEETRRKLIGRISPYKGKTSSEETRKKIKEARAEQVFSEETRLKLSQVRKGHPVSEDTRRKLSEANKGYRHTEDARRKMSEAAKGRKRGPYTEEHRRNISEAKKRKGQQLQISKAFLE